MSSIPAQLLVHIDEQLVHVTRKQAKFLSRAGQITGDKTLITDFNGAAVTQRASVDSPVRYAEMVLQRRLQERGEVAGQSRVFSHWKVRRGANGADLYYTALPAETYAIFTDQAQDDPDQHLLFAPGSLLYALLRDYSRGQTIAVLFEHDRHVDYLVGRGRRVIGANRISSYSRERSAKAGLEDTLLAELRGLKQRDGSDIQHLVYCHWMLGNETWDSPWIEPLAAQLGARLRRLRTLELNLDSGETLSTSLPAATASLKPADSVSPIQDRLAYQGQHLLPRVATLAALGVAALLSVAFWWQQQTNELQQRLQQVEHSPAQQIQVGGREAVDYTQTLAFVQQLAHWRSAPSMRVVLADVSAAAQDGLDITHLVLEYPEPDQIQLRLRGRIDQPFPVARERHLAFVNGLRERGFELEDTEYSTDVERLEFSLAMRRGVTP